MKVLNPTQPNQAITRMNSKTSNTSNTSNTASKPRQEGKPFCKVCYDAGKPEREYTSHFVRSKPGNEGIVVCPYLLSIVCNYCKKKAGHTTRHCPDLIKKENKAKSGQTDNASLKKNTVVDNDGWATVQAKPVQAQAQAKQQQQPVPVQAQAKQHQPLIKSPYSAFSEIMKREEQMTSENELKAVKHNIEYPALKTSSSSSVTKQNTPAAAAAKSWANIAKAPVRVIERPESLTPPVQQETILRPIQNDEEDNLSEYYDDDEYEEHVDAPPPAVKTTFNYTVSSNWADELDDDY